MAADKVEVLQNLIREEPDPAKKKMLEDIAARGTGVNVPDIKKQRGFFMKYIGGPIWDTITWPFRNGRWKFSVPLLATVVGQRYGFFPKGGAMDTIGSGLNKGVDAAGKGFGELWELGKSGAGGKEAFAKQWGTFSDTYSKRFDTWKKSAGQGWDNVMKDVKDVPGKTKDYLGGISDGIYTLFGGGAGWK